MKSYSNYGGEVHKRPEILFTLNGLVNHCDLEEQWKKECKPYLIKCKKNLSKFDGILKYRDEETCMRQMISLALDSLKAYIDNSSQPEVVILLKDNVCIIPNEIIGIFELDKIDYRLIL